ncbi:MAG: hypothetical protein GX648_11310 [Crenarchaeota archaeon]|nr:hypothetical protein [Thermoproteota archaeon]
MSSKRCVLWLPCGASKKDAVGVAEEIAGLDRLGERCRTRDELEQLDLLEQWRHKK